MFDWELAPEGASKHHRLRVFKGGAQVDELRFDARACSVLGRRADQADVVIAHPSLSRRHAALVHGPVGSLHVVDLGSSNGTRVNGEPLPPNEARELADGDSIKFGESTRTYRVCLGTAADVAGPPPVPPPSVGAVAAAAAGPPPVPPPSVGAVAAAAAEQPPAKRPRGPEGPKRPEGPTRPEGPQRPPVEATEPPADAAQPPVDAAELPVSFGKQPAAETETHEQAVARRRAEIAAMTASMLAAPASESYRPATPEPEPEEEDQPQDQDQEPQLQTDLPVSHQVALNAHSKAVTALAADKKCIRCATGAMDQTVRLWDFGGMDRRHRAFRTVEPEEGHHAVALSYSPSGDRLLVCTGSSCPQVLDRDGLSQLTFAKGDMYLLDATKTKGHTHNVTGGHWSPADRAKVATCGTDATVRLWDVEGGPRAYNGKLQNTAVARVKDARGQRTTATALALTADARAFVVAGEDGSLQMFRVRARFHRPDGCVRAAHEGGSWTSALAVAPDNTTLASRGGDGTVKLWDLRRFKEPLAVLDAAPQRYPTAGVAFSPDGSLVVAGAAGAAGAAEESGRLLFWRVADGAPVLRLGVGAPGSSVVALAWHAEAQQIFAGSSTGETTVLYDPRRSVRGAVLSASREPRRRNDVDMALLADEDTGPIFAPNALPMFREEMHDGRRRRPKGRVQGPAKPESDGALPAAAAAAKRARPQVDARAALLRHAGKAPSGLIAAPAAPLAKETVEEETDRVEKEMSRRPGV